MDNNKEMATTDPKDLTAAVDNVAYGFEDTKAEDILIPRIKVINALSPERIDGEASEGDIINSLTKEKLNGKRFIPIKQYYSNIRWDPDINADVRIHCRSFDGKVGQDEATGTLLCAVCKKNQFNNAKTGREAIPSCTSYLNFLGFFEGSAMPVVLSFSRTNYNEGKKMLSIAKSMRTSIWNYAYVITSKKITKERNTWFILVPNMSGATTAEERVLARDIYMAYEQALIKADYEDMGFADESENEVDAETAAEI